MNRIKRFMVTAGIYLMGNVLSKLIGFFLLPLYTGKLPPELFGTYDLIVAVISVTVPIVFLQVWDGMYRFAFEKHEAKEKYGIISNSFLVWVLGSIIYTIAFLALSRGFSLEYAGLIFLYGMSVAIQYHYLFLARAFLRNKLFVMSGLVNSLLSATATIVLILKFNMGIEALYIAPILGCLAQISIIEIILHPLKHLSLYDINVSKIKEMIRFSLPLCVATVLYWLVNGYTKIAISQQLGTYANGLFAVSNRFCSVVTFLVTVFQYAWYEMAYLMAKDENRLVKYEKSVEYIFKVVLLGSGVFMLFSKLIFPFFIDAEYSEALSVVPLSLIGVAANSFVGFIDTIFMAEKQTNYISRSTVAGAAVNVAALWIFTPLWGLQGAIGALCLAFTVLAIFRLYILNKKFSIKFNLKNCIYLPMLCAVVCIFYTVDSTFWLVSSAIMLSGISAFCLRDILSPLFGGISLGRRLKYQEFK